MSKFCGKHDLYDSLVDRDDQFIANSDFYIRCSNRMHKLDIHNRKDVIRYYPFLIFSCGVDNKNKRGTYYLCERPYFEELEESIGPLASHYREQLFEHMIENGYSDLDAYRWCFSDRVWDQDEMLRNIGRIIDIKATEINA